MCDVDGDGNLDLVTVTSSSLFVRRGRGDGTFVATPVVSAVGPPAPNVPNGLVTDVDGDGRCDVAYLPPDANEPVNLAGLIYEKGQADATFQPVTGITGGDPYGTQAHTTSGLGFVNVTSGRATAVSAVWTRGFPGTTPVNIVQCSGTTGGCSTFVSPIGIGSMGQVYGGTVGDVDGDHLDDVLVSSFFQSITGPAQPATVTLLKGTGTSFVAAAAPAAFAGHVPVAVYDLDQDGRPDVGADDTIFWGDASLSFAASSPFYMSQKADFDGDGNLDLFFTGTEECLIFGAGGRVFGQRILFTPQEFVLLTGPEQSFDVNGDGADDGFIYQSQSGVVSIYVSTAKTTPGAPDIQCGSVPADQCTGPSSF